MNEGTNVYEGKPDDRQSANINQPVSRFRLRYRALTDEEKAVHDAIKLKAEELEALYERICGGRYKSLALTALEESVIWAIKELTGQGLNPNSEPKNEVNFAPDSAIAKS